MKTISIPKGYIIDYIDNDSNLIYIKPNILSKNITEVIDNFDFNKVAIAMKALNWTYLDNKVPNEIELKNFVKDLISESLEKLMESGELHYKVRTGGFTINIYHINEEYEVYIDFILESSINQY